MSDPIARDRRDADLVAALRALPLAEPGEDAWRRLSARLRAGSDPRPRTALRRWWPLAAAALLALAVLPLRPLGPDAGPDNAVDPVEAGLIAQSQWLERLLTTPALSPQARDGDLALLELGLQARLGDIDAALADSGPAPVPALWQARVDALAQLAAVRLGERGGPGPDIGNGHATTRPALLWAN
ncbi:MAG: hypothetical protein KF823_08165 [Xanthomonadales bacterium]|nr:hypothetical protein [Xanthomonadales bacterium]